MDFTESIDALFYLFMLLLLCLTIASHIDYKKAPGNGDLPI